MKRYSEYKGSGVDWIGEIPKHWVAKKLRYFCSMKSGNGFSHDLQGRTGLEVPFFKVADTNTPENEVEMAYAQNTVSSQDVSDFKFILHKPNSIVFPKVGATLLLNKRNILTKKSCIDNNMMSLYSDLSNYRFLYYAMLNVDFKRHYRAGGTVPSINESEVGNIPIAYPPPSEQTQIANFLDRKTGQIDELIRIKERQVELLQEQRTVLINQAVTKGLDPNVEMKPSGVEWIGEIPKDWEVTRLKYICELIVDCEHKTAPTQETGYPLIRTPNIGIGHLILDGVNRVSEATYQEWSRRTIPQSGDLILAREAPIGNVAIIPKDLKVCLGQRTVLIRPDENKVYAMFLVYLMLGDETQVKLLGHSTGAIVHHLNMTDIRNLELPRLPSLPIQHKIANFLDHKTKQIDELISTEGQKIELLKEYRQSLISEAVTGKIDVRNEV